MPFAFNPSTRLTLKLPSISTLASSVGRLNLLRVTLNLGSLTNSKISRPLAISLSTSALRSGFVSTKSSVSTTSLSPITLPLIVDPLTVI